MFFDDAADLGHVLAVHVHTANHVGPAHLLSELFLQLPGASPLDQHVALLLH